MIGNLRLRYLKFIAKIWRGEGQYTNESVVGERVITNANIRINRETKDLELLVSGDMQIGDGERRKEQYSISFPLWNYSISLEEKGISDLKETIYLNLGVLAYDQQKFDDAIKMLLQSLNITEGQP